MAQTRPLTAENEMRERVLKGAVKEWGGEMYELRSSAPHPVTGFAISHIASAPPDPRWSHLRVHRDLPPTERPTLLSRPFSILCPFSATPVWANLTPDFQPYQKFNAGYSSFHCRWILASELLERLCAPDSLSCAIKRHTR